MQEVDNRNPQVKGRLIHTRRQGWKDVVDFPGAIPIFRLKFSQASNDLRVVNDLPRKSEFRGQRVTQKRFGGRLEPVCVHDLSKLLMNPFRDGFLAAVMLVPAEDPRDSRV